MLVLTAMSLLLAACDQAPPEAPLERPPLRMDAVGHPAWRAAHHLHEADFTLPPHNQPEGTSTASSSSLLMEGWRVHGGRGPSRLYVHPLPFNIPPKRYNKPPAGLYLQQGSDRIPYQLEVERRPRVGGWAVVGDQIYLSWPDDPAEADPPLVLHRPGTPDLERRLAFSTAVLPPEQFVDLEVTLGPETRRCLLVPAPGSLAWDIELPADPVMRLAYAIRPPDDLEAETGDGVDFQVRVDGTPAWSASIASSDYFREASFSLRRWAGQRVRLELVSDPRRDPVADLAVFCDPTIADRRAPDDVRRVLVIGLDSFRPDYTGVEGYPLDVTPELDAFASQSYLFQRAYAPSPRTKPSFRTAFTGRHPLPAVEAPTFADVLRASGFATGGLSANVHLVPRFRFHSGFDTWYYDNGAQADIQVDRAISWLKRREAEDSFLFLHIMDPHIFYNAPWPYGNMFLEARPEHEPPRFYNRWKILELMARGRIGEAEQEYIRQQYLGELRYTSAQLGRLFGYLDELPGRTLVILHSDHGEEFWEHGSFEHNHSLYDELVRALFWVRPPGGWGGGPHEIPELVGLVDLAPTIFDILEVPEGLRPPSDGVSLRPLVDPDDADGVAELRELLADRPIQLGYQMYDAERWGVVHGQGKYILHTMSGEEELYDLEVDPGEQENLAGERAHELPRWRQLLARATGWDVGPGLRIAIRGLKDPFSIEFSEPVAAAGVIDPETDVRRRANLEWGQTPSRLPEEVAEVTLSEDSRKVAVAPSSSPTGTIYILFGDEVPGHAELITDRGATSVNLDGGSARVGSRRLTFAQGTVVVPTDTMRDRYVSTQEDDATMDALRLLGYVE